MICPAISNCWLTMFLMPAGLACLMTERILVPKMRFDFGFVEQRGKLGHRLHQVDAVLLGREALVHLQERHDVFHVPEIIRAGLPLDVPVHGVLEQDGGQESARP